MWHFFARQNVTIPKPDSRATAPLHLGETLLVMTSFVVYSTVKLHDLPRESTEFGDGVVANV